jgi:methionyl-tRNA formyltransferase
MVAILTDNIIIAERFVKLLSELQIPTSLFKFFYSAKNKNFKYQGRVDFQSLSVNQEIDFLIEEFDTVISLHCKQFFPKKLVEEVVCINVHPGYNPDNRGWFPQVFSIINDTIIGATIHLMDEKLDNGPIIDRCEVEKEIWDTSETLYNKVLNAEIFLLKKNLQNIIDNSFDTFLPEKNRGLYLRDDFTKLCNIDLEKKGSFYEFYNYLRALTHGNHKNAYFIDRKTKKKVFLTINIEVEDD